MRFGELDHTYYIVELNYTMPPDVLDWLKEMEGNTNEVEYQNNKAPMIPTRLIDSFKIYDKLGWSAKTTIYEGLEKTLNWYKSVYLNK